MVMIKSLKRTLTARVPVSLKPQTQKKVLYAGFQKKDAPGFDEFVARQVQNPVKIKAIELLAQDGLLGGKLSLLDIGCGPGAVAQIIMNDPVLVNRISYTGVDVSRNAIGYLQSKIPEHFTAIEQDVVSHGIPEGRFDVIMLNEMLEHIHSYEQLVAAVIDRGPKVIVITTFGVLLDRKRDRRLWNRKTQCYMNSYAFERFYRYLRGKLACPIMIYDYETIADDRYWFPKKQLLLWYIRPAEPTIRFLKPKKN
jgi:SAM-dependent methyltransferase